MRKYEIYGVSALLGLALTMGVTACSSSDDPKTTEVITVPEVKVINTITGMVSDKAGEPIKGAVVTKGTMTCTTGEDGFFNFDDVAAGKDSITVTATGKISAKSEVVIPDTKTGSNTVVNFTLANEGVKLQKNDDGTMGAETETETLKGNEAGKIEMTVEAPADLLDDEEAEVVITPTYSEEDTDLTTKASTRAADELYLAGTKVSCTKPGVKMKKSMTLTYFVDPAVALTMKVRKCVDGKWSDVANNKATNLHTGQVNIIIDEFATYALYCEGSMSGVASTEPLTFTQSTWDNTNGSSAMSVGNAEYSYKIGTDLKAQTDKVLAYLVEMLARVAGATVKTTTGSYAINVSLPVGAALSVSGTQTVNTLTAKMGSKSITANSYGNVSISTKTWTRNHTGGGSK